jgi:hypothetical protein
MVKIENILCLKLAGIGRWKLVKNDRLRTQPPVIWWGKGGFQLQGTGWLVPRVTNERRTWGPDWHSCLGTLKPTYTNEASDLALRQTLLFRRIWSGSLCAVRRRLCMLVV